MIRHPQHILAFDKKYFGIEGLEGFIHITPKQFFERASQSLFIGRREELEKDERFGQALPYVVMYQKGADDRAALFAYQRTKQVGEQRLAGAISVGVGGHMDLADIRMSDNSVVDLVSTFAVAVSRELNEEILFDSGVGRITFDDMRKRATHSVFPKVAGMIVDNSNEVGRVHYGVILAMEIPEGFTPVCAEPELTTIGMAFVDSLPVDQMENWSKIVLKNVDRIINA
jgi:predicted NUDIX family phosphoesterase